MCLYRQTKSPNFTTYTPTKASLRIRLEWVCLAKQHF